MRKVKTREFWAALFFFLLAVLSIAIIVKHIADWGGDEDYLLHEPNDPYTLAEVASRWTHLTYFTNLTLLLFCVWAIADFLFILLNLGLPRRAAENPYVILFLAVNQFIVLIAYTLFTLIFGFESFPYDRAPGNLHNFATSLLKHYFITTASVIYLFSKRPKSSVRFVKCLLFLLYPAVYAVIIKIVGMTCFSFEWYPYPFFGTRHLWIKLFGTLSNFNSVYAVMLVAGCLLAIAAAYVFITFVFCKIYNALYRRETADP